jgi:hypothetical protein
MAIRIRQKFAEGGFLSVRRPPPESIKHYALTTRWDESGTFWVPDAAEHAVPGRLAKEPGDRTHVVLDGSLPGGPDAQGRFYPVLHGRLGDGMPCSLLACHAAVDRTDRGSDGEFIQTRLYSDTWVQGTFCSGLDHLIDRLACRFSHLEQWFGTPYQIEHARDGSESLIRLAAPSLLTELDWQGNHFRLELACVRTIPNQRQEDGLRWGYHYELLIARPEPTRADWFLSVAAVLKEALTFLMGNAVATLDLIGYVQAQTPEDFRREVRLLPQTVVPALLRERSRDFSAQYATIHEHLPSFFEAWLEKRSMLAVVIEGYAEVLSFEHSGAHAVFLRVAQMLEHFHGIITPSADERYYPRDKWRCFRRWLQEHFPLDDKNKAIVIARIGNLNRLSFRSRIESLVEAVPGPNLMPLIGNPVDPEAEIALLIKQIDDTRNFLTHFDEQLRERAVSGRRLRHLATVLWGILTFHLARTVGLPDETSCEMMRQAQRPMFIIGRELNL